MQEIETLLGRQAVEDLDLEALHVTAKVVIYEASSRRSSRRQSISLAAQRHHGIDFGRAARGQEAGHERD